MPEPSARPVPRLARRGLGSSASSIVDVIVADAAGHYEALCLDETITIVVQVTGITLTVGVRIEPVIAGIVIGQRT